MNDRTDIIVISSDNHTCPAMDLSLSENVEYYPRKIN